MSKPTVFDDHSKNYNETHDHYLPAGVTHDQFRQQKLEWVTSFAGATLLDFGCNAGELCLDLANAKPELKIIGVDESRESIAVAKERCSLLKNTPQFFHTLEEIPSDQKFDLITVFNVLHHVEVSERESVLQKLAERLSSTGILLIWEHNRWNPLTRYLVKICPFDKDVTLVGSRKLLGRLEQCGLRIQAFGFVNILPPGLQKRLHLSWIDRVFGRVPLGAQYRLIAKK